MAPRTIHTKVSIGADVIEILTEISKAYASDRLTPVRETSISGALEKAARIYIEEIRASTTAPAGVSDTIAQIEQKYVQVRAAEAEESARKNVLKFRLAAKRGRPRKNLSGGGQ